MTAHTPGPWYAIRNTSYWEVRDKNRQVADTCATSCRKEPGDEERGEANARLIAAAPEMLSALKAVEWAGQTDVAEGGYKDACPMCGEGRRTGHIGDCPLHAAIAKAEGRT